MWRQAGTTAASSGPRGASPGLTDTGGVYPARNGDAMENTSKTNVHEDNATWILEGLVRVAVPRVRRPRGDHPDRLVNDAVLEMAIDEVAETLYIFVDGEDKHETLKYIGELYNLTWDLACVAGKEDMNINITSSVIDGGRTWLELSLSPTLDTIYSFNRSDEHEKLSRKKVGLLPIVHRSPVSRIEREFIHETESYMAEFTHRPSTLNAVVVCGTFDHLHGGHKRLLAFALSMCRQKLIVAITASERLLALQPFPELIESLEVRKAQVADFVKCLRPHIIIEFDEVVDGWGPASIPPNTMFVVSSSGVVDVQRYRCRWNNSAKCGWFYIRVVRRTDKNTQSSSRIRQRISLSNTVL